MAGSAKGWAREGLVSVEVVLMVIDGGDDGEEEECVVGDDDSEDTNYSLSPTTCQASDVGHLPSLVHYKMGPT